MNQLFRVEQSERTSDDYITPQWVFDTLAVSFDLDVASPPWETYVPAQRIFTKADDGLVQDWDGSVWMNPPFSRPKLWAERFMNHSNGIALLPMAKSQWFVDVWANADAIA